MAEVESMRWWAWGEPGRQPVLPDGVRALLEQALGVRRADTPPVAESDVRLTPSALPAGARDALVGAIGADHLLDDDETRLLHAGGKSTIDLLRRRSGDAVDAPDAVLLPGSHDEVLGVLQACAEHGVAVVPFGGGTSVVGGVEPVRGGFPAVVALDLSRLADLVDLDEVSMVATLGPGLRGPAAEELLGARGYTLGHFPQSFEYATLGGFAAARSAGQASSGYGRFEDLVVGLKVATPQGTVELGKPAGSAAGPDLVRLFLGSEGVFGVITELRLRVHRAPAAVHDEAWRFPDFATGAAALRSLAQAGALPTVARLSDEVETAVNLAQAGDVAGSSAIAGGCLAITCYEGLSADIDARGAAATAILTDAGGTLLGTEAGAGWRHGRYAGPYLRDALLDVAALAETLETAASWSALATTYDAVRSALVESLAAQGTPPLVLCHISHLYPTGASLYFTVVCAAADDPIAQWRQAKSSASEAIVRSGATITHHHAVGVDHRDWMVAEVGELGVAILRSVKSSLDPVGVLNPGKLIP